MAQSVRRRRLSWETEPRGEEGEGEPHPAARHPAPASRPGHVTFGFCPSSAAFGPPIGASHLLVMDIECRTKVKTD
jgi:hypothetical protein